MAMKQRLMMATAVALVLCVSEATSLLSSANSTEMQPSAEAVQALAAAPVSSPSYQTGYPSVVHPAHDAWAAVFRSTAR